MNNIKDLAKSLEGVRVDKLENCFAHSTELIEQLQKQTLLTLGKEILKHQEEMLLYNSLRSSAVPVSAIIKAFDNLGVKIEDKIDF